MEAQYSLNTFAKSANVKRPKEIACYARDSAMKFTQSPENYPHFFFQDGDLADGRGYDLKQGFSAEDERAFDYGDMSGLFEAIIDHEKKQGKKVDAKLITWRGLIRKLMLLPFDNRDKFVLNIVPFDGQLFMQSDVQFEREKFQSELTFRNEQAKMAMYSGYKFERLTTLDKPWGATKRSEIESRRRAAVDQVSQYATVVKTTIGSVDLVIGAEVDAVWDFKPKDGSDPLKHYVELKCTKVIDHPKAVFNFEKKLLAAWAQCFLVGIPRIIYGFRDDQFILRAIEEFSTDQIPIQLKNNPLHLQRQKEDPSYKVQNKPMLAIKFINGLLEWLEKTVPIDDESKTYSLEFDPAQNNMCLKIKQNSPESTQRLLSPYNGAEGGIFTEEFKEWRKQLRSL